MIVGPKAIIDPLIDGIEIKEDCSDDRSKLPDISFTIDDTDYTLKPDDYIIETIENVTKKCMLGIQSMNTSASFKYIRLGATFIRPFPTYFNANTKEVTFFVEAATQ